MLGDIFLETRRLGRRVFVGLDMLVVKLVVINAQIRRNGLDAGEGRVNGPGDLVFPEEIVGDFPDRVLALPLIRFDPPLLI